MATRTARTSDNNAPKLLTPQLIEETYGIPVSSTMDLIRRGTLPAVKIPGQRRWRVLRRDLDQLIAASREVA